MNDTEALIKQKIAAGLTREQAKQVIAAQAAHDAEKAQANPQSAIRNPKSK